MPFIIAMYITFFIYKAVGQVFFSEVYCWGRQTLGSALTYQVLTGLVRTHVRRPVCLRFKNATNWSGLIRTQNFVILEILRWELAHPLVQAERRAKDPDFSLKAAFCIVLCSLRTTGMPVSVWTPMALLFLNSAVHCWMECLCSLFSLAYESLGCKLVCQSLLVTNKPLLNGLIAWRDKAMR